MNLLPPMTFDDAQMLARLAGLDAEGLDHLPFGVIGFDAAGLVKVYNAPESRFSGLRPERVVGRHVFVEVAQCMNNYLVAQRFDDAADTGMPLDATIDYVLTWRMAPTSVRLRMLCAPASALRYLVLRHARPAA